MSSKPLTELIDKAGYIALVLIERGEIIPIESELNAAIYSARVLDGIKGVSTNEVLEFGSYAGFEIGAEYLVFLAKPGNHDDVNIFIEPCLGKGMSSDGPCGSIFRHNWIIHSSFGAMKVLGHFTGSEKMVRVSVFVRLPDKLKAEPIEEKGQDCWMPEGLLVPLRDVVTYLKTNER